MRKNVEALSDSEVSIWHCRVGYFMLLTADRLQLLQDFLELLWNTPYCAKHVDSYLTSLCLASNFVSSFITFPITLHCTLSMKAQHPSKQTLLTLPHSESRSFVFRFGSNSQLEAKLSPMMFPHNTGVVKLRINMVQHYIRHSVTIL